MPPKGWFKHPGYDMHGFGQKVREARITLKNEVGRRLGASSRWTLEYIAKACGIDRGTLQRVENGKRRLPPGTRAKIAEYLVDGLKQELGSEVSRREVLISALTAFIATGVYASEAPSRIAVNAANVLKGFYLDRDEMLNWTETFIKHANQQLYAGESQEALEWATDQYARLMSFPDIHSDLDLLLAATRVGLIQARAQEVAYSWTSACVAATDTYNKIEADVLRPSLARFRRNSDSYLLVTEYVALLDSRSRMMRRIGKFEQSLKDAQTVLRWVPRSEQRILEIDARFKYAHIWACLGLEDRWRKELIETAQAINTLPSHERAEQEKYQKYYEGEGYKRLAFNPYVELTPSLRARYAEQGFAELTASYQRIGEEWHDHEVENRVVGFHPIYTRMSQLQCMIFADPNSAKRDLDALQSAAARTFPALLEKLSRTSEAIQHLQRWRSHNPLPGFDLDVGIALSKSDALLVRARSS